MFRAIILVAGALALLPTIALAQICDPIEIQKILASDGANPDGFGVSVSVSGDTAVIGASGETTNGSYAGAAYVFRWDGSSWVEQQKLLASDGARLDQFGMSVSISGDVILVGAYGDDDSGDDSGSAYVFRWNGSSWREEEKLLPSDGAEWDWFGFDVSIDGETAVVGAIFGDGVVADTGAAYVFRWNGSSWVQEQKLFASDGAAGDDFYVVSTDGGVITVGAARAGGAVDDTGAVYGYRHDGAGWVEEQKLVASDGATGDSLGRSCSVDGDALVAGAPGHSGNGDNSGAAYVFRWNGSSWVEEQRLAPSDGTESDAFGISVSIDDQRILVGAQFDSDWRPNAGSAYAFRYDPATRAWTEQGKLSDSHGQENDVFGFSVAVSGTMSIVGVPNDDDNGDISGSAFVFDLECSCPADITGDGLVNTRDFIAFLNAWASGDPLADWNDDGTLNTQDFIAYLNDWAAGC